MFTKGYRATKKPSKRRRETKAKALTTESKRHQAAPPAELGPCTCRCIGDIQIPGLCIDTVYYMYIYNKYIYIYIINTYVYTNILYHWGLHG